MACRGIGSHLEPLLELLDFNRNTQAESIQVNSICRALNQSHGLKGLHRHRSIPSSLQPCEGQGRSQTQSQRGETFSRNTEGTVRSAIGAHKYDP